MTVKQALKRKSKLLSEISEMNDIAQKNNSLVEGTPRRFSVSESLAKATELTDELIELKVKIHSANLPVYDKIFRMSELKNQIKNLKKLSTKEGVVTERYGSNSDIYEVELNAKQIYNIIKEIEKEIDSLQDELDYHNSTTKIN